MEYHVSKKGSDINCGSEKEPFLTISKAALVVKDNDTVVVHEGVYRECVSLDRGAQNQQARITFCTYENDKVVIKGSEEISCWEKYSDNIYVAKVPNEVFGSFNPYAEIIYGDWYTIKEKPIHTGQVYLDGKSLREVTSLEEVKENNWYTEVKHTHTEIYANFGKLNPNEHLIEINVRKACFVANYQSVDNITVSGFEMCHAATNWAPPTAGQSGLICANWCKGWIIENNIVHDSRCSGICLGKDKSTGHNTFRNYYKMHPHYCQIETVFAAILRGWSKDFVGSHIVRNNTIYNCGQTGIVGHLGAAFSEVYGNHIYNIQNIGEMDGSEIAGIKFHAPIDTYVHHNIVHDCYRGIWLDWQVEGVRVSSNILYNNAPSADLYVEVTHGPLLFDNNVLLSPWSIGLMSQGNAFVNNFFGGTIYKEEQERHTPYHFPHSTAVKGIHKSHTGDDRIYNNIFVGGSRERKDIEDYGTCLYNGQPDSFEDYTDIIVTGKSLKLPAYIDNNVYLGGALAYECEKNNVVTDYSPDFKLLEEEDGCYLEIDIPEEALGLDTYQLSTDNLPITLYTEAKFENPNGTKLVVDKDCFGNERSAHPTVGPFENLKCGKNKILLWKK